MNLLKPYYSRAAPVTSVSNSKCSNVSPALIAKFCVFRMCTASGPDREVGVRAPDNPMVCGRLRNSETLHDLGSLLSHMTVPTRCACRVN